MNELTRRFFTRTSESDCQTLQERNAETLAARGFWSSLNNPLEPPRRLTESTHKAEALQRAEKADPRVDLEWMRIRYERDLNVREDLA